MVDALVTSKIIDTITLGLSDNSEAINDKFGVYDYKPLKREALY